MTKYSEEFMDDCCETLVKADEIQNNKELMHELEPMMKEKSARMAKVSDLKTLWKKGLEDATAKDDANESDKSQEKNNTKIKGEKALQKEAPKLGSKD